MLQRAVLVRKKLSAKEGGGWLSGTLFCTHFRVAFVPQDSQKPDVSATDCSDVSGMRIPALFFPCKVEPYCEPAEVYEVSGSLV